MKFSPQIIIIRESIAVLRFFTISEEISDRPQCDALRKLEYVVCKVFASLSTLPVYAVHISEPGK